MIFTAYADGRLRLGSRWVNCALGSGGVAPANAKTEGDGVTPAGLWPLRRVLWRADREPAPATRLPVAAIQPTDGWCDAPGDPAYNRLVRLPYAASAEALWRDDEVYDVIVVLGYNDAPVRDGAGSAVFLHVARPGYAPTAGCVALSAPDLAELLRAAGPGDCLEVRPEESGG